MNNEAQKTHHILYLQEGEFQQTIYLEKEIYSIGRHSENSIRLYSHQISRQHATLIKKNSVNNQFFYMLIDGNLQEKRSQNGILVNGKKKINHELKHGDIIVFGTEEVKAVYQIKEDSDIDDEVDFDSLETQNNLEIEENELQFTRDELENTLIIEEQNLNHKLKNADLSKLASFSELSPNPIIELDFLGNITYLNPAANLKFENLLTLKLKHPLLLGLNFNNQGKQGKLLIREVKIQESLFEQYIHYLSEDNQIRIYIHDITERKQAEYKLRYQAFHDSITGLPNRDYFYEKLTSLIVEYNQRQKTFAILFIDLDRFKNINDSLSHLIGDQLLEAFAYRLLSCINKNCFLARWGGDEFTLIIQNFNQWKEVEDFVKIIMDKLKEPFYIQNHTIYITVSIGISFYPQDGKDKETLIKNADVALSRAKTQGRNKHKFYTSHLNKEASFLFKLENNLHQALPNNELFLCYQPQINIKNNKIHGLEALLRWNHPELNIISPSKFIPIAEETGLIIPIGDWVLETACYQLKTWQKLGLGNVKVAVNISIRQFREKDFTTKVIKILEKTKLEPEYLELEITESLLMQDVELATKIMKELRALGVTFSLDDFGTGYSSLSYLKKFPFQTIKIDKSFVINLKNQPQDLALISAVIVLGKGFNMEIVAEGVQTEQELQLLKNLDCEIMQGQLFSSPLKTEDIPFFVQKYIYNNE